MKQPQLESLTVTANVSEAFQVNGENLVVQITTSESSAIICKTSLDGVTYSENSNFSETVDGTDEFNLTDFVEGQYVKFEASSGTMTACKVLG